jgi:hypothetical protein
VKLVDDSIDPQCRESQRNHREQAQQQSLETALRELIADLIRNRGQLKKNSVFIEGANLTANQRRQP